MKMRKTITTSIVVWVIMIILVVLLNSSLI